MAKTLIVSIKPEFTEMIIAGKKTIELRKSAPDVNVGDIMIIYCTYPIMAFIGVCKIGKVLKLEPLLMWKQYKSCLGIDYVRFSAYYHNVSLAIGIEITEFEKLNKNIKLEAIKNEIPSFQPPQTFRYLDSKTFEKLLRREGITVSIKE